MISENIFIICSIAGSVIFFFMGFFFGRHDKKQEEDFYRDFYEDYITKHNIDE